jgi:hypothetical protein
MLRCTKSLPDSRSRADAPVQARGRLGSTTEIARALDTESTIAADLYPYLGCDAQRYVGKLVAEIF